MGEIIKYFFLDGWSSLQEIIEVLEYYSLDEFQLFVVHNIFSSDLYVALEDYLTQRCMDYLSGK